jgi:anti-sigma factor RsiW
MSLVGGRLTLAEAEPIEQHLTSCAACAQAAVELARTWDLLDMLEAPKASPSFDAAVFARLRLARRWLPALPSFQWQPLRLAPVAALAAAMLVTGWLGVRSGSRQDGRAQTPTVARDLSQEFTGAFAGYPAGSVGAAYVTLVSTGAGNEGRE